MNKDIQIITEYLSRQSEIDTVYLFGSQAIAFIHDKSDIDLGIIFKNHASDILNAQIRIDTLKTEVQKNTPIDVDMVDLEYAPLPLQQAIIQGRSLFCNNLTRIHRFENAICNKMELDYYDS